MPLILADCPRCHGSGIEPGAEFRRDHAGHTRRHSCRLCGGTGEHRRSRLLSTRRCRGCGRPYSPLVGATGRALLACPACLAVAGQRGRCRTCGAPVPPSAPHGRSRRWCNACDPHRRVRRLGEGGSPAVSPGTLPIAEASTDGGARIAREERGGERALPASDRRAAARREGPDSAAVDRDEWQWLARAGGVGGVRIA